MKSVLLTALSSLGMTQTSHFTISGDFLEMDRSTKWMLQSKLKVLFFDTVDCSLHYGIGEGRHIEVNMAGVEILTDKENGEGYGADESCQIYYTFQGRRFYRYKIGQEYSQTIFPDL